MENRVVVETSERDPRTTDAALPTRNDMVVTADHRENAAPVVNILRSMPGVEVQMEQLRVGDYRLNGWIFERKTVRDFAQSIIDGRLFSQAHQLASSPALVALILEGKSSDLGTIGVPRPALQGALISLSLIFQIPVLRSTDPEESARLLIYAAQQLVRQESGNVIRHGYQPKQRRRRQIYILQGLPGIGMEKAGRLLDHFGSVEAVMTASEEQLQKVEGIGEKIAHGIRSILRA